MKVALCLHGYYNNGTDSTSGDEGYKYIYETIISKYNPEIFIHSWEPEREKQLIELYKPIYSTCEEQADFGPFATEMGISQEYFDEGFNREYSPYSGCKITSTLSFLYSRMASLRLAFLYEQKKKFEYDVVITARFDLGQRDKFGKWKYYVSQMNFDPARDMTKVYSAMWDQLNAGYADQWFYSNSANMKILGTAFEKCLEYFKPESLYEYAVTNGWPDSIEYDHSFTDLRQFTNEKLKSYKTQLPQMRYPKWQCINNHLLYKWFFIDTGLYDQSEFV